MVIDTFLNDDGSYSYETSKVKEVYHKKGLIITALVIIVIVVVILIKIFND